MTDSRLKLAFAGTPELARTILDSLVSKRKHEINVVFTQPDRPAGRGQKITKSRVKQYAMEQGIPVLQPANSKEFENNQLKDHDLLLVVAYGIILSPHIINKPRFGSINIHTSLLPRWRGAAPIQRAIEAGDNNTGVSFMQMDENLDTGPVLLQKECPIHKNDTTGILHDRLARLGAKYIHSLLDDIAQKKITAIRQNESQACYANKITKHDAALNWNEPAIVLERKIRAFNPFPVTHTKLKNIDMRIWEAHVSSNNHFLAPGTIIKNTKESIDVVTSKNTLSITKLQLPGKKIISAKDFLNGNPFFFATQQESDNNQTT